MQKWVVICWALLALVGADECPDRGRCEKGLTCCKHPANGYECCPFDQAECCEDHIHCCPVSTVCDMSTSSCVNATISVPWAERASADQPRLSKSFRMIKTYVGEEDDNICPDQSRCPPEFSCLRALTRFGCCPLAQGIPCADGKHCCPEGLQCSADSRSCIKKELAVLCSDGVSECPDGTTCCEDPEGKWGCCPLPKATCCDDKKHCCPEGSTCDIKQLKCISSSTKRETPMWAKLPARRRAEWENEKGSEQVVAEPVHNESSQKNPEVTTANKVPPFEREVIASSVTEAAAGNDVPCDDTTACVDGTTCCKTKEGGWACCPLPEAVCCEDFIHCCPKDTTCDLAAGKCKGISFDVPLVKKTSTIPRQVGNVENDSNHSPEQEGSSVTAGNDVPCDDTTACQDGTTCCKTKEGGWACCPLPEAVCCEDFIHCCPKGTTCDLAAGKCDGDSFSLALVKKMPTIRQAGNVTCEPTYSSEQEDSASTVTAGNDVPCDDTTACQDGTTCCKTKEGGWACCPLPEAVCCEDFIHCCPKGTTCDLAAGKCSGDSFSLPLVKKMPTIGQLTCEPTHGPEQEDSESTVTTGNDVPCDDTTACEDGTTCCKTKEGGWACCPLPEAVCCDDFIHCCPKGKTCNLAASTCDGDSFNVPLVKKKPTIGQAANVTCEPTHSPEQEVPESSVTGADAGNDVPCDDTTACEDGTTCCRTEEGGWACCPLPEAVCCEDLTHCCPKGKKCNVAAGTCEDGLLSVPWVEKISAILRQEPQVALPGIVATTIQSQVTSTAQTMEEQVEEAVEEVEKEEEEREEEEQQEKGRVQCDPESSCPPGTTCCFMTSAKRWGCCPLPDAVCCLDGVHCCPVDYKCGEQGASCIKNGVVIPWYTKLPARTSVQAESSYVQCDDQSQCPEHTSCCKLSTGEWGCCPIEKAVCCPDMEHCCPQGYVCNIASKSCEKLIMLQLETVPLTRVFLSNNPQLSPVKQRDRDVKCDDQTSCNDGETCCRTSKTTWGCCPYPNGVCCADLQHCCPTGYTCTDTSCTMNKEPEWSWDAFVSNKKRALHL